MPNNEDVKLPKAEVDRTALEKFYREVWGFTTADAKTEADIVMRRGPSSPIYQDRMGKAWQHLDFTGEGDAYRANIEPQPQPAGKNTKPPAPKYLAHAPTNNVITNPNRGFAPPPAPLPSNDPDAYDYPAASYDPAMNPYGLRPGVTLPGAYPEDVMSDPRYVDPKAFAAQQALNERRARLQEMAKVPISPAPLKPAAPTPTHLEDANLSSWQSLAGLLGY